MGLRTTRRRVAGALVAVLALGAGLVGCSASAPVTIDIPEQVDQAFPDATAEALQTAVTDAMVHSGSPGAIVGVWAPWSGEWVAGLGTSQVDGGAAVTPEMQFRAGKITRAMTCDVLYGVVDDGLASLDDSVSEYVAGVPDLAEVTLQQLCDSTSGVGSFESTVSSMWLNNPERVWKPMELAAFGLGKERKSGPGEIYSSSDTGYVLLGLALEHITRKSAADLFDEYISQPLSLEATGLGSAAYGDDVLPGLVSRKVDGEWDCAAPLDITSLSTSSGFTDAGAVVNITDLGRYAQALASGALVADEYDRFTDPKPVSAKSASWFTTTGGAYQAGSLIGQYGSVPGYLTAAFADPDTGLAVAVVLNNSAVGATFARNLAWELAAIASKAPAASGQTAPEAGLPWTAEQYAEDIADAAICKAPAE
ncbi:serine hydrolase [Microbacterium sp. C7(2022)]|uniref:serine hydrolase domain-containing protein n=1 Tax=Microbacterium sp. C7(2022) TaxID=2992759 RepID=UPI00237AE00A|nr:serine hydrolase domain-containing protein [Microbacterium sp. C7(2022)]MDE0546402.1 beta-lactamase family protein [Microbacterium sp. C7(2022)]